MFPKTHAECVT